MKAIIFKVFHFLKYLFLRLCLVITLRIGKEENKDHTTEYEDSRGESVTQEHTRKDT